MMDFLHSLTWNRRVTMPTRMFKINCEVSYFLKVYYKIIKCSLTVNLQKTAIIYVNYLQFTLHFFFTIWTRPLCRRFIKLIPTFPRCGRV